MMAENLHGCVAAGGKGGWEGQGFAVGGGKDNFGGGKSFGGGKGLAVVGGGPGGYVSAIKAAQLGLKVRRPFMFSSVKTESRVSAGE